MLKKHRILVTRAADNYTSTASLVYKYGGIPIFFPCMQRLDDIPRVQAALALLHPNLRHSNTHILFTSATAVEVLALACNMSLFEQLKGIPLVAIGNKTATALQAYGLQVAVQPSNPAHTAQCFLFSQWQEYGLPQQVIFFRAAFGSDLIVEQLQAVGVQVTMIAAYSMCCPPDSTNNNATIIRKQLKSAIIDAVLLGSSRTAIHYCQRIGLPNANRAILCAISHQVANDAKKLGLDINIIAKEASFAAMLEALAIYFG